MRHRIRRVLRGESGGQENLPAPARGHRPFRPRTLVGRAAPPEGEVDLRESLLDVVMNVERLRADFPRIYRVCRGVSQIEP